MTRPSPCGALLLALAAACTEAEHGAAPDARAADAGRGEDVGVDASALPGPGADFTVDPPAEPTEPAPLSDDCPSGWVEGADGPCTPPPRLDCAGATYQLPGDTDCRPLGSPCPDGGDGFPDEDTLLARAPGYGPAVLYVHPSGSRSGDCAREAPCATVRQALARAEAGALVALSVGRHTTSAVAVDGVALVGACAAGATLAVPGSGGSEPAIRVTGEGGLIADLTLTNRGPGILVDAGSGAAELRALLVRDVALVGIGFRYGAAGGSLQDVVVRRVGPEAGGERHLGFVVEGGAIVTAARLVVEGCSWLGVATSCGDPPVPPRLVLQDSVIRAVGGPAELDGAVGLNVTASGVEVSGLLVEGVTGIGVNLALLGGPGAPPTVLRDVAIRDISLPSGTGLAANNSSVRLEGVSVARAVATGLVVHGAPPTDDGEVAASGLRISDVHGADGARHATALLVEDGGRLTADRIAVADVSGVGVAVRTGAWADLADLWVRHLRSGVWGKEVWPAYGLHVLPGCTASVRRSRVEDVSEHGFVVGGGPDGPARLEVSDAVVRGVTPSPDMLGATGIWVGPDASASLARVRVEAAAGAGILALGKEGSVAAVLTLSDVTVADIDASLGGVAGVGLAAFDGARVTGSRVRVERATVNGLGASALSPMAPSAVIDLEHVVVRGTRSVPETGAFGGGVEAMGGGRVTLRHALIEDNRWVAVLVQGRVAEPQTEVLLEDVVVRDTLPADCAELPESDPNACREGGRGEGGGSGIACVAGGRATVRGFSVSRSAVAGLLVASGGVLEGHEGRVFGNSIGVNIADPDYRPELLEDEVYIFDNRTEVASRDLLLPEPGQLVAEGGFRSDPSE